MTTLATVRFIADEIIKSVAANSLASLCDRLTHTEIHGSDDQIFIARSLREFLEEECGT